MGEFVKGLLLLGISVILFLLVDYFKVDNLKDLF